MKQDQAIGDIWQKVPDVYLKIGISICKYGSVGECIRYPEVADWCPACVLVFFTHGASNVNLHLWGFINTLYVISV